MESSATVNDQETQLGKEGPQI
jgi:hypothetical protein